MKDKPSEHYWYAFIYFFFVCEDVLLIYFYPRNIDGWMTLEIPVLMWQRGRARFDFERERACFVPISPQKYFFFSIAFVLPVGVISYLINVIVYYELLYR
jgi:hypothetical protein